MADEHEKRRSGIGWGIPASILLHVVFAFVLFFHLPLDFSEPQKEESLTVEIVPPLEEKKAEEPEKAEEEKPLEIPKFDEAKKEEAPPPSPPPPPPEPEKQEEAKREEPPPSPPEPPKEEAKKQEPPPPPQEEAKPEERAATNQQAPGSPIPVLRPVFEFGEKDSGPRKSKTGNASQETTKPSPVNEPDAEAAERPAASTDEPDVAETPSGSPSENANVPENPEAAETPSEEPVVAETPGNPMPEDVNVPEIGIASANPQQNGAPPEAAPDATSMEIVPLPAAATKSAPSQTPQGDKPNEMKQAKTLFSQQVTGDTAATTARGDVPRGVRAGELCATELREQLRHGSPSYRPELLPAYRLPGGTVLEVKRGAFRASGQWFDLSFRCEVDEDANKVASFAFNVGSPVPQSEWGKRGFPQN